MAASVSDRGLLSVPVSPWGSLGRPWGMGGPWGCWGSPGGPGVPMGVPRAALCRDLIVKPDCFYYFLGANKNCAWAAAGLSYGGVGNPKLAMKTKSDENEGTKAESSGHTTPWAYRAGEYSMQFLCVDHFSTICFVVISARDMD